MSEPHTKNSRAEAGEVEIKSPGAPNASAGVRIPGPAVAKRYGVSVRTLDRWLLHHDFPRPLVVNHRRYFSVAEIERWEIETSKRHAVAR